MATRKVKLRIEALRRRADNHAPGFLDALLQAGTRTNGVLEIEASAWEALKRAFPVLPPKHGVLSEFQKARDLFRRELCSWKSKAGNLHPLPCRIHDVFRDLHAQSHNCIGCNFAGAVTGIERVLGRVAVSRDFDEEFDYGDYILSLYLFVERAHMLFDIISLPEPYRHRHFGVFQEVKRWANFLKHPNYFILVHHPVFQAGGTADTSIKWEQVVDTQFVVEHYGHDAQSKSGKLKAAFVNKTKVLVLFPDVVPLTERFCAAVKRFVALIEENAVFRELLDDIATYENYFDAAQQAGR